MHDLRGNKGIKGNKLINVRLKGQVHKKQLEKRKVAQFLCVSSGFSKKQWDYTETK